MKILICFVFLFGFCYCVDESVTSEDYRHGYVDYDYDNYGRYYGYDDRAENGKSVSYPCSLNDIPCIQQVFAYNSRCYPAQGPRRNTINFKRIPLDIPHANLTLIMYDGQIKGLRDWKIQEFYINKTTDKLVFEVVFDRIEISTPRTTIRVYRKGKEPVELTDSLFIEYSEVSITLTIPHIKDLQLSQGTVYTYLPEATPKYALGPKFFSSPDPDVMLSIAALTTNVSVSIREAFVIQGRLMISAFLQNNICNFGYY